MSAATDDGRISVAGLAWLSVQRYPLPAAGLIAGAMPSCGAAPLHAIDMQRIVVPVHDGDAVWLGLTAVSAAGLRVWGVVETAHNGHLKIGSVAAAPMAILAGFPRDGGGLWPFTRRPTVPGAPACRRLLLYLGGSAPALGEDAMVKLSFVRPYEYWRLAGKDPGQPADPAHQFGQYLLG
ncbi:hypothetical protein OU994_17525 [Pseudoduganella sp. SL102]|uniref:hypothetical protein n=1 Tax=Pseudoduganella sp. SL102 TaxID=2995154 RepID=UPI00248C6CD2|nr:hypothetical protein [Pseudoduganella sp. SL102]WBS00124.1 hypothetical protein OU994_17525 [Pseudoduganella sp. SL102]